ncbi:DUF6919 domain-containing protein [Actinacidiphila yeochonensis]|uniref:DUF6919 domain-containing protein n=1 Tax=Actinacidiphila yeochonensis TaxID=89050 RepID=UPI000559BDB5|nr:hypothetical protein [Actinacidiphila yeochonensis]
MTALTWTTAQSLRELSLLMAAWLEGRIPSRPAYYGPAADETTPLVPVLAAACRAGYLTDSSQPGVDGPGFDGRRWRQRAAVTGYIPADAVLLTTLCESARLAGLAVVLDGQPGGITVTEADGRPVTGFGDLLPRRHLRTTWAGVPRPAVDQLVTARQLTIVDLTWGPTDLLWQVLAGATR